MTLRLTDLQRGTEYTYSKSHIKTVWPWITRIGVSTKSRINAIIRARREKPGQTMCDAQPDKLELHRAHLCSKVATGMASRALLQTKGFRLRAIRESMQEKRDPTSREMFFWIFFFLNFFLILPPRMRALGKPTPLCPLCRFQAEKKK